MARLRRGGLSPPSRLQYYRAVRTRTAAPSSIRIVWTSIRRRRTDDVAAAAPDLDDGLRRQLDDGERAVGLEQRDLGGRGFRDPSLVEDQGVRDALDRHVDLCVRPLAARVPGTPGRRGAAAGPIAAPLSASSASATSVTVILRMDGLSPGAVTPWLPRRKGEVKQREPPESVPGGSRTSSSHSRSRSVGQLAPQPDLTRQCAFDLRSRLGILAIRPDGQGAWSGFPAGAGISCYLAGTARRSVPVRSSFSFLLFRLFESLHLEPCT